MGTSRFALKEKIRNFLVLAAILLIAASLKAALVLFERIPFNSDEAVVALMARHILGGERPVFFYGQAYMGSLDGWLVAIGFWLFGLQVWVIRLVQGLLYLLTILTTVWIGKEFLGSLKIGLGAGLLLAIPTVNVTLYTTASLGGYGEALLIGNLIMISALKIERTLQTDGVYKTKTALLWLGFGLFAGLGLWANGLTLIYSIPAALHLAIKAVRWRVVKRNIIWLFPALMGFFAGSIAWWGFAVDHGAQALIRELFGSAVAVEGGGWLARTGLHLRNLLLLGFTVTLGFRPPWSVAWLALPLIPLALFVWVVVFIGWRRLIFANKAGSAPAYRMLAGVCLALAAGFLFTSFGVDPTGRYFTPLVVPFSLAASGVFFQLAERKKLALAGFGLLVIFHLWGTVQTALKFPPGITTQFYKPAQVDHRRMGELIGFLKTEGITRGYTNYWVAYPLAFLSDEELIFIPRLPYHADLKYTARDDRYPPYQRLVDESNQIAYITTNNPALDELLINSLRSAGVDWREKRIGDYLVFYNLSEPIRPQELGIIEK